MPVSAEDGEPAGAATALLESSTFRSVHGSAIRVRGESRAVVRGCEILAAATEPLHTTAGHPSATASTTGGTNATTPGKPSAGAHPSTQPPAKGGGAPPAGRTRGPGPGPAGPVRGRQGQEHGGGHRHPRVDLLWHVEPEVAHALTRPGTGGVPGGQDAGYLSPSLPGWGLSGPPWRRTA